MTKFVSPLADGDDDNKVLKDRESLRVHMLAFDNRVLTGDALAKQQALADAAYLERKRRDQEAWRTPQQARDATENAAAIAKIETMAQDDAQKIRDQAYREYVHRVENAWKQGAA
jgi:hypothetical protein